MSYSIYRTAGAQCRNLIGEAFEEAERLVFNNGTEELQELFNLCNPVNATSPNDVSFFFQTFYDLLIDYVQQHQ